MAIFRVARASEYLAITGWGVDDVKLAKKAWVWPGLQRCKVLDVSPVSYDLEAHGVTADGFPLVLAAAYTVGPNVEDAGNEKQPHHPLLLYAKVVAPSRRSKNKGRCSTSHVKKLVQGAFEGHVRALAPSMAAHVVNGGSFVKEVLDRVEMDLGSKYGIRVYNASVNKFQVHVPANKHLSDSLAARNKKAQPLISKAAVPANHSHSKSKVQQLVEQVLPHAALYFSARRAAAALGPWEQARRKADAERFLDKDLPETIRAAMENARRDLLAFLLRGDAGVTREEAERFFEQDVPGMASVALDRTRRAFAVLVGNDDDETDATRQQVAEACKTVPPPVGQEQAGDGN